MPSKQNRIRLSELEPETDYSLTIQGQNVAGSSPISNSIRFRTKPIGKYKLLDIACKIVLVPFRWIVKLMLSRGRSWAKKTLWSIYLKAHFRCYSSIARINMKCHFLTFKTNKFDAWRTHNEFYFQIHVSNISQLFIHSIYRTRLDVPWQGQGRSLDFVRPRVSRSSVSSNRYPIYTEMHFEALIELQKKFIEIYEFQKMLILK